MKSPATKREYWRSLEHLADAPHLQEAADKEFLAYDPQEMMTLPETSRRKFLQLTAASMALAGLTLSGCRRWPEEKLAPYTAVPKGRMPGLPEQYATVFEVNGVAQPLLVTSFDGRPIKIEGNPTHPYSATIPGKQGAATVAAQASVLEMYDPNRSRSVVDNTGANGGRPDPSTDNNPGNRPVASDFARFVGYLGAMLAMAGSGEKMAVLIESTSSPSTARLRKQALIKFPKLGWYEYEPVSRDNETEGARLASGQALRSVYHLDQARIIVSIDNDFIGQHPAQIRHAADWASRRRTVEAGEMSRVYAFESAFTLTGTIADRRIPMKPSHAMDFLISLANTVGVPTEGYIYSIDANEKPILQAVSDDLLANKGAGVLLVGSHLTPEAHQLALLINEKIGAIGSTLTLHEEPTDRQTHVAAISELAGRLKGGNLDTLLILGGNPVYNAPADLAFADALKGVANSIHVGHYFDETAELCKWHLPRAHYLESWGDARAFDGSVSVVQPLIEPLFGGKTIDEILALFVDSPEKTSDTIVRKTFASDLGVDSDSAFRQVLNDGLLTGSELKALTPTLKAAPHKDTVGPAGGFEVRFLPSQSLFDGRFAANAWLQEIPDTLTKLVWDNAAIFAKADADKAEITTGDMVTITLNGKSIDIVAYVLPGQPAGVIGLPLGYGRTAAGPVGTAVGFNVYPLRTAANPDVASGATVAKTGKTYDLAMTQDHQLIDKIGFDGREDVTGNKGDIRADIIRQSTLAEFTADKALFKKKADGSLALQLFDPPTIEHTTHKWGMAVDMNSCIGCEACVVACQAENNIPVVGKAHAENNRTMHWIRIDRYFRGDAADPANDPNPEIVFQPVMCQHCENAPCEQVCPVGATMHDTEGLNVMVYNRCIGTRYCSNNCPYKVRRFNYLDWQSQDFRTDKYPKPYLNIPDQQQLEQVDQIKRMVFNPEVTIRMRGVMEKCTYCIQRIHKAEQTTKAAGNELADGDIVTACQQTCPTQAIVFGDLNDKNSRVSQLQASQRSYLLLSELDTRPRTQYLARVRNV